VASQLITDPQIVFNVCYYRVISDIICEVVVIVFVVRFVKKEAEGACLNHRPRLKGSIGGEVGCLVTSMNLPKASKGFRAKS